MKARIKKTGEVVNLASYAKITLECCDSWGNPIEVKPEEVELIDDATEDEHWQDIWERAAIAAMQGMLANPELLDKISLDYRITIERAAIGYANELIEQLKKK